MPKDAIVQVAAGPNLGRLRSKSHKSCGSVNTEVWRVSQSTSRHRLGKLVGRIDLCPYPTIRLSNCPMKDRGMMLSYSMSSRCEAWGVTAVNLVFEAEWT